VDAQARAPFAAMLRILWPKKETDVNPLARAWNVSSKVKIPFEKLRCNLAISVAPAAD